MTLLVPNVGEQVMLQNILNKVAPQDQRLKLYTNNITPSEADTAASYTEAVGFGYAAIALTGAGWTITPGTPSTAVYALQTFNFTGALGNVYGYFVVQAVSGILLWAERFTGAPFVINSGADKIDVTPQFTGE